ncbi:DUF6318 family protein [Kribbella sp. NPDC049174]|uniref:DUF6318 family protein n=1 Tax=Kribbella sp. NPDC049174 TaxID=3364112 RepID=UPI003712C85F
MTNRNRPLPLLLACLSALALLPACTPGSPEAGRPNTNPPSGSTATSNGPTGTTAPTATTTPTATSAPASPPTRPSNATGLTLAAAESFISYYISLQNYAYATGDSQYFLSESDKGCIGCKAISDFVKFSNGSNGGLSGDYLDHLVSVKEVVRGSSGKVGGSAEVRSGAYMERPSPSAKPVARPASTAVMEFTLATQGSNWIMYELEIIE